MLVTPGPGWVVIFLGLGLLAAEFVWARRLMDRMKHQGGRIVDRFAVTKNKGPTTQQRSEEEEPS